MLETAFLVVLRFFVASRFLLLIMSNNDSTSFERCFSVKLTGSNGPGLMASKTSLVGVHCFRPVIFLLIFILLFFFFFFMT